MASTRGGARVAAKMAATLMLLAAQLLPGSAMAQQTAPHIAANSSLMSVDTCEREALTASCFYKSCCSQGLHCWHLCIGNLHCAFRLCVTRMA